MGKYMFLAFCIALSVESSAQYGNVWAFGRNAGINFNSNPPQAIRTAISTREGSSSVCDDQGQLLFYTDGTYVRDRNHNVMPNGNNLPGFGFNITNSTAQGTLIIPLPGNATQYYIFSLGCVECGIYAGDLYYSVVDMSLNNGLGAVVTGRKGILLSKGHTEHMTAVSGDNCNIWLLVMTNKNKYDSKFKAYNVGFNGIDTVPVISTKVLGEGGGNEGTVGIVDVSPDRSKLAITQGNLVLYDFDRGTGQISNPVLLDYNRNNNRTFDYYGVCFSPDNTKVYSSIYDGTGTPLFQFDLSTVDTVAMIASKIQIAKYQGYSAIKRGPDGKVYCTAELQPDALNVINQPNLAGAACQHVANGLPLLGGTYNVIGLPNSATIVINRKIYSTSTDTAYCADSFLLEAKLTSGVNYVWDDGSTGTSRYVNQTGTYWISYQVLGSQCDEYADTFHTAVLEVKRTYFTTTTFEGMCAADTFLMVAAHADGKTYTWEDGTLGMSRKMNRSGIFWVTYWSDTACELFVDTFLLSYPHKDYEVSFITDTLICQNDTISFKNTSNVHFNQFDWSFGDGNNANSREPTHGYLGIGTYQVQLIGKINEICLDTALITIVVDPIIPIDFVTDRNNICVGESITLSHQINSNTLVSLQWDFGDSAQQTALEEYSIKHAYAIAGIMPVKLNAQFRACADSFLTDTIYVFDLPQVDLGKDSSMCLNGVPIVLKNLRPAPEGIFHYVWNTGSETETLKVTQPGSYSLTVSSVPMGCSSTESIAITKDCYMDIPNAFTPNGDGINDYFFPRQYLSAQVTSFRLQVFNRWGQVVYVTTNKEGRGWDGKFNNEVQPQAVYVYNIEAHMINGITEQYQGNVTLIR
jgi:gliding motility-associated-like protein